MLTVNTTTFFTVPVELVLPVVDSKRSKRASDWPREQLTVALDCGVTNGKEGGLTERSDTAKSHDLFLYELKTVEF